MLEENQSLSARVYRSLEDDILTGRYQPDDELKEKSIADEMGVSRTPVREALRQLELQGLVTIVPNRGARVVGLTRQDMHDIYEMRSLLEGLCAAKAAKNATREQIEAMEETVYLSEFHTARGHSEQVYEEDNRFHQALYEASGSPILQNTMGNLHHYLLRIRKKSLESMDRCRQSNEEHRKILEAVRRHDAQQARQLADAHIRSTMQNIESQGWEKFLK